MAVQFLPTGRPRSLAGVGRKTANVVLNTAFGHPTIAVDTHIFRVANRTGLAPERPPWRSRRACCGDPAAFRRDAHHWLILHGRYVCRPVGRNAEGAASPISAPSGETLMKAASLASARGFSAALAAEADFRALASRKSDASRRRRPFPLPGFARHAQAAVTAAARASRAPSRWRGW